MIFNIKLTFTAVKGLAAIRRWLLPALDKVLIYFLKTLNLAVDYWAVHTNQLIMKGVNSEMDRYDQYEKRQITYWFSDRVMAATLLLGHQVCHHLS